MEPWGIWTSASVAVGGLRFETVEYEPGHWAERHAHGIGYVDLVLSGAQEARWAGSDVRRTPGTVALMPIGEAHATDSVQPTRTFQVSVEPSWEPLGGPCAHLEVGALAWGVTGMWAEFRRRDDLTPLVLEGRFRRFLDLLAGAPAPNERAARWLRRANDYVRAHARAGFAVGDVAAEVGIAPAHLMRSYAAHYGVTMGDDARRHRVVHACRLLHEAEGSLGEVAMAAGFSDQSHLNRVFKFHTGLTPREYRTTCRGG